MKIKELHQLLATESTENTEDTSGFIWVALLLGGLGVLGGEVS